MPKTRLTFACELDPLPLQRLFADPEVVRNLKALGADVSLAIRDFTPDRAAIVRELTNSGIPVIAWLVLAENQGYWFHVGNSAAAASRYDSFLQWTKAERLTWAGIGVDMEVDIAEARLACTQGIRPLIPRIFGRLFSRHSDAQAHLAYSDLLSRIRSDGFFVESYVLPFLADERRAKATLFQKLCGTVEVPSDREVMMLYTSFARRYGASLIDSYGPEADVIGIGSTGGGVDLGNADRFPILTWEELARDLRIARKHSERIFVFSLEGCVANGHLEKLLDFDWKTAPVLPTRSRKRVRRLRLGIAIVLWVSRRIWWIIYVVLLAIIGGFGTCCRSELSVLFDHFAS